MITMQTNSIEPLRRLQGTIERFTVELGPDQEDRDAIAQISLLEPGVECVVCILTKEDWEIMKEAFKAL